MIPRPKKTESLSFQDRKNIHIASSDLDLRYHTEVQRYGNKAILAYIESILSKLQPNEHLSADEITYIKNSMNYLQMDTLEEFRFISDTYRNVVRFQGKDEEMYESLGFRPMVFLILANTFNRCDELLERATASNGDHIDPEKLFFGILDKGAVALVDGPDGKRGKRVSPRQMIEICRKLAQQTGIDTADWSTQLESIYASQIEGMKEIQRFRKDEPTWTVEDAIAYKRNTVGVYARLLGRVLFNSEDGEQMAFRTIMRVQAHDDVDDIVQDYGVQINPFLSLLREDRGRNIELFREISSVKGIAEAQKLKEELYPKIRGHVRFNEILAQYLSFPNS